MKNNSGGWEGRILFLFFAIVRITMRARDVCDAVLGWLRFRVRRRGRRWFARVSALLSFDGKEVRAWAWAWRSPTLGNNQTIAIVEASTIHLSTIYYRST